MKRSLSSIIVSILFASNLHAQTAASITWKCILPDSQNVSVVTGALQGTPIVGSNFVVRDYTGTAAGPLGSNQRWWPGNGVSWGTETAPVAGRYIEMTVRPTPGSAFSVSSINLYLGAGGTSGMKANLSYAIDGGSSVALNADAISLTNGSDTQLSYAVSATVANNQTLKFRIDPWYTGAIATSGKYVYLQQVVISGVTFISDTTLVQISTTPISAITHSSAVSGGTILSDGGNVVTSRGVCWNTSGAPTISDAHTEEASGIGTFTGSLNGLSANTKYYVRAYAVNNKGTTYGNEISFTTLAAPQVAFPGAEGWGRYTLGGRGGEVIEVTNLNDSGVGSLRAAVQATGPRTVVFRVSGTITLNSSLSINNPYITIAGQTAPGDGICVRKYPISVNTNQVIIRYVRARLGNESGGESDAFTGRSVQNVIIDHCSASWSEDETMSFYWCNNFTIQWCLISESLYNSNHVKGAHGYGGIWGGANSTYHHNLLAHHSSRNPRFGRGVGNTDYRNNVVYNWGFNSTYGGEGVDTTWSSPFSNINMVNNYYKKGPATKSGVVYRIVNPSTANGLADYGKWFIEGNYVAGYSAATADNWAYGVQGPSASDKTAIRLSSPAPFVPITQESAEQAYVSVLAGVGASLRRDSVDLRILNEVQNGTATYEGTTYRTDHAISASIPKTGIIDAQTDVGGWPVLNSLPAPVDTDHDGMSDEWETAHGLNPALATDRNTVAPSGFTMVEEYINSLAAGGSTGVIQQSTKPTGFEMFQNYPNPFNPTTTITFGVAQNSIVTLKVFDLLGREVETLVNDRLASGSYSVRWNAAHVSSGMYVAVMQSEGLIRTTKMTVSK